MSLYIIYEMLDGFFLNPISAGFSTDSTCLDMFEFTGVCSKGGCFFLRARHRPGAWVWLLQMEKTLQKEFFFRKPSEIGKRIMRHATVQIRTPYNPWDWYIYLHEWLILMVNVGKLYHTWIACLVNFLLGWTTGESHQITWSAEAKGSRKLVQPPSEVIKRCRSTSQVDLQDIFKSGLVDSWRTCRRREGSGITGWANKIGVK